MKNLSLGTRRLIGGLTVVLAVLLIGGWLAEPDFVKLVLAILA